MVSQVMLEPLSMRQDGFGTRYVERMGAYGRVERLLLAPALSTPASEQAIRARAAHLTSQVPAHIARVVRVDRKGTGLAVLTQVPDGVTLSDLLAALEFGTLTLSDDELLELVAALADGAGRMHEALGTVGHGALSSAHVWLTREAKTCFSGAVFGDAIQAMKHNREHIWREFALSVPASAGPPRFDQRGDVAQLGGLVLAIAHRRSLQRDEFPRNIAELVAAANIAPSTEPNSRVRTWLQDALQLHGRVAFESCVDAARKLRRLLPKGCGDEAGALALRTAILQVCGDASDLAPSKSWAQDEWQLGPARSDSERAFAPRR